MTARPQTPVLQATPGRRGGLRCRSDGAMVRANAERNGEASSTAGRRRSRSGRSDAGSAGVRGAGGCRRVRRARGAGGGLSAAPRRDHHRSDHAGARRAAAHPAAAERARAPLAGDRRIGGEQPPADGARAWSHRGAGEAGAPAGAGRVRAKGVAPRASRVIVGFQEWRDLLFLHWRVPAAELRPLVHPRLAIDEHGGSAWVSMTPFTLRRGRLRGLPPLPDFHELNFRTYVTLNGVRGIWFFSLDAANSLAVAGARLSARLPYFPARMERGEGWYRSERTH